MNEDVKIKMDTFLEKQKAGIKQIRESLFNVPDSDKARRQLQQTEMNILSAMHEISWIGLKHEEEVQEEVLSYTDEDNPSAE